MKKVILTTLILSFILGLPFLKTIGKDKPIPWGAMYVPSEYFGYKGMRGIVKYYQDKRSLKHLLNDLKIAHRKGIFLIITIGKVDPNFYLKNNHLDMRKVYQELSPFFKASDKIQPYIDNGTIWGIRFLDEPHNPKGFPRGFKINEEELGKVFKLIKKYFKGTRVGSTAPARYMINVPYADFAFGQYNHRHPPYGYSNPIEFFKDEIKLAKSKGLDYVASLNSSANPINNYEFFLIYKELCSLNIDFLTSWQWPKRSYHQISFEERINDPNPQVQAIIKKIPSACGW